MAVIMRDLLNKNHYATSLCSQTFLVSIVMIVATFVLPYILVVLSRSKSSDRQINNTVFAQITG